MATQYGLNNTKVEKELIKRSVNLRDKIFDNIQFSPFYSYLESKGRTMNETQQKFEWLNTQLTSLKFKTNAVADTTTTSVVVKNNVPSTLKKGMVIKNIATNEQMLVTNIAGTTLTVIRGYSDDDTKANIADNAEFLIVSEPFEEGSVSPDGTFLTKGIDHNYMQIFRRSIVITRNKLQQGMYGDDGKTSEARRKDERNKVLKLLQRDIENQLLFGKPKQDLTGANPKHTTGGLFHYIKSNVETVARADDFRVGTISKVLGKMADNGAEGDKIMFAGSGFIGKLNDNAIKTFAGGEGSSFSEYGVTIQKIATEYGMLEVMYNQTLSGIYSNTAVIVDPATLMLHKSMDIQLNTNIEIEGFDGIKDDFITELGLEVNNESCNAIIRLNF